MKLRRNYCDGIRAIAIERQVQYLFHFTQTANLRGVVTHGLRSRGELAEADYTAFASDEWRLDEDDDAVSVSVSRVNEPMFAAKRELSGHSDWVVLVLTSEILWTHECLFSWTNAAKNEIKKHGGFRGGPWAFERMFAGSAEKRQQLPYSYPTDHTAEVQVFGGIAPGYIVGAVVDQQRLVEPVQSLLDELGGFRPVEVEHVG